MNKLYESQDNKVDRNEIVKQFLNNRFGKMSTSTDLSQIASANIMYNEIYKLDLMHADTDSIYCTKK